MTAAIPGAVPRAAKYCRAQADNHLLD